MTRFLLDTDTSIYFLNRSHEALTERVLQSAPERLAISVVTAGELLAGARRGRHRSENEARLRAFFAEMPVLHFDFEAANAYGAVRAILEDRGELIEPLDTMIAAHALSLDATLVTNNTREFRRVQGLRLENWTRRR